MTNNHTVLPILGTHSSQHIMCQHLDVSHNGWSSLPGNHSETRPPIAELQQLSGGTQAMLQYYVLTYYHMYQYFITFIRSTLFVCLCVCLCAHACMCAHMRVCVRTCACACTHTCTCACARTRTHTKKNNLKKPGMCLDGLQNYNSYYTEIPITVYFHTFTTWRLLRFSFFFLLLWFFNFLFWLFIFWFFISCTLLSRWCLCNL